MEHPENCSCHCCESDRVAYTEGGDRSELNQLTGSVKMDIEDFIDLGSEGMASYLIRHPNPKFSEKDRDRLEKSFEMFDS